MIKLLYDFFSSVKVAIVLLLSLAATSIVGTIIEQQQDPDRYLREYGETAYRIFKFLGFTDVYHSWWYVLLLSLLGLNILVCSIRRFPRVWKFAMHPRKTLPQGSEANLKVVHKITLRADSVDAVASAVTRALAGLGYKTQKLVSDKADLIYLFSDKNIIGRFGVYVVHAGVFIILIGGLLTAIFGYKGYMSLCQGCTSNLVTLFGSNDIIRLPFYVGCDEFKIERYPSGMPKEYISNLKVINDDGQVVKRKIVEVNAPLKFKNIYFYQANYGTGSALFFIKKGSVEKSPVKQIAVAFGQPFLVSGNATAPVYLSIVSLTRDGAVIELTKDGRKVTTTIEPQVWYELAGTSIYLAGVDYSYYTGLQVSYDPGTWIVWIGSTVLVLGLFIAFFVTHKRVWSRITLVRKNRVSVVIGGFASRVTESFEKELEKVLGDIQNIKFNAPKGGKNDKV